MMRWKRSVGNDGDNGTDKEDVNDIVSSGTNFIERMHNEEWVNVMMKKRDIYHVFSGRRNKNLVMMDEDDCQGNFWNRIEVV